MSLSSLDQPAFDDAGVTKRQLVDYLDGVADRFVPAVADRALSVVRVRPGQPPFMQKNLPAYAPEWISTTTVWAERSRREVRYPLCNDRRTLLWLANQRSVEYHPALIKVDEQHQTHLVLDLDPPPAEEGGDAAVAQFRHVVAVARLVERALADAGLAGAVKTSGAKGLHVFVPLEPDQSVEDVAAATRALAVRAEAVDPQLATTEYVVDQRGGKVFVDSTRAGGATVVAAYSPRARPGLPVSFPLAWDELDDVHPSELTITTALGLLDGRDPWAERMPSPQRLPDDLVEQGRTIPIARVRAMHEGKRRKREAAPPPDPGADAAG